MQVFHREVFLDLFYLLYYIFDSKTNAHFYADDTALYTTGSSLILMTAKLQPADTLKKYFSKCKCVLNYDKTNHVIGEVTKNHNLVYTQTLHGIKM